MFRLQHYDFDLDAEDLEVLDRDLPLLDQEDSHILVFNLSGDRWHDGIFGDSGRLEVWMRHSDVVSTNYDTVASFIRST